MSKVIEIVLNGKIRTIAEGSTLQTLVDSLRLDASTLVIELNETVVNKSTMHTTELYAQDKVEVLQFVGGG